MMKSAQLYVYNPVQFFGQRVRDEQNRLLPFLILTAAVLADLLCKTIIFYKIGQNNFKSQSAWAQIGGGYFGSVIGQEIAVIEKFVLLMVAMSLVARLLKKRVPMTKIMTLLGYCFLPSVIGSLVAAVIWQQLFHLGIIELSVQGAEQLRTAMLASPAYMWQRMINLNVLIWTAALVLSVMAACWGTRLVRTLMLGILAAGSAQGTDMLLGFLLKKFGVA
ncbi:MAG TPA: YIP1 family protein [Blastocatellia bacterium]|nr:YIP1 family protein [Blastocatellia bacterium]